MLEDEGLKILLSNTKGFCSSALSASGNMNKNCLMCEKGKKKGFQLIRGRSTPKPVLWAQVISNYKSPQKIRTVLHTTECIVPPMTIEKTQNRPWIHLGFGVNNCQRESEKGFTNGLEGQREKWTPVLRTMCRKRRLITETWPWTMSEHSLLPN